MMPNLFLCICAQQLYFHNKYINTLIHCTIYTLILLHFAPAWILLHVGTLNKCSMQLKNKTMLNAPIFTCYIHVFSLIKALQGHLTIYAHLIHITFKMRALRWHLHWPFIHVSLGSSTSREALSTLHSFSSPSLPLSLYSCLFTCLSWQQYLMGSFVNFTQFFFPSLFLFPSTVVCLHVYLGSNISW